MTALTPDEWREMEVEAHYGHATTSLNVDHKGRIFAHSAMGEACDVVILNEAVDAPRVLHATAALCLYDQPFGFNSVHVALLHIVADDRDRLSGDDERADELRHLADRIAALLPPDAPQTDET